PSPGAGRGPGRAGPAPVPRPPGPAAGTGRGRMRSGGACVRDPACGSTRQRSSRAPRRSGPVVMAPRLRAHRHCSRGLNPGDAVAAHNGLRGAGPAAEEPVDALLLSRIQFGFVITFHILFTAFTIGLAHWLAFLEWRWLRTRDGAWRDLYFFWLRIFAISFGMGVVSGIVMSFQFGTNWAVLSERAGAVLGPLLSYEVLTAFFLEASFLGVM